MAKTSEQTPGLLTQGENEPSAQTGTPPDKDNLDRNQSRQANKQAIFSRLGALRLAERLRPEWTITTSKGEDLIVNLADQATYLGVGDLNVLLSATAENGEKRVLKFVFPVGFIQSSPEFQRSFLERIHQREAELLSVSDHPSLPRFYGQTEFLGKQALVREQLQTPLSALKNKLSASQAAEMAGQIADALSYLHAEQDVIVTDVSLDNIFSRADGSYCLGDLNLAPHLKEKSFVGVEESTCPPELNEISLSLTEQEPEKIRDVVKPTAQVYSLARSVFYLMGGRKPDATQMMMMGYLPPIERESGADISEEVIKVLQKATALDPSDRHQSLAEFIQDLKEAVSEE